MRTRARAVCESRRCWSFAETPEAGMCDAPDSPKQLRALGAVATSLTPRGPQVASGRRVMVRHAKFIVAEKIIFSPPALQLWFHCRTPARFRRSRGDLPRWHHQGGRCFCFSTRWVPRAARTRLRASAGSRPSRRVRRCSPITVLPIRAPMRNFCRTAARARRRPSNVVGPADCCDVSAGILVPSTFAKPAVSPAPSTPPRPRPPKAPPPRPPDLCPPVPDRCPFRQQRWQVHFEELVGRSFVALKSSTSVEVGAVTCLVNRKSLFSGANGTVAS